MKIQVASDIHIEFERPLKYKEPFNLTYTDADVIVLAGDIGVGFKEERNFVERIAQEHGKPVIFVLGNHSFYAKGNVDRIRGRWAKYMREEGKDNNVFYLDEGYNYTFGDTNFVGGIFWTDFNDYNEFDMLVASDGMNDYQDCRMSKLDSNFDNIPCWDNVREYLFTPRRSVDEHYKTKEYMSHMLSEWKGQRNVVVTHHLPSAMSTDIRYKNSSLNPAYCSNLEEWIMDRDIDLWIHGHTHSSNDYYIKEVDKPENGKTRVVCNPRGYFGYKENMDFNPGLVI